GGGKSLAADRAADPHARGHRAGAQFAPRALRRARPVGARPSAAAPLRRRRRVRGVRSRATGARLGPPRARRRRPWRALPVRSPAASGDGPGPDDFWSKNVWGEGEARMLAAIGSMGDIGAQADRLRTQLLPFAGQDGKPGFTSPVTYPQSKDGFPRRLAGLAA